MDNSETRKRKEETVTFTKEETVVLSVTEALDMMETTLLATLELVKALQVRAQQK